MSTLGKVLTFLNVLVAVILLVIAGMDYAEWRAAHYAAFRHELVITGLPVDENERSADRPDDPIVDKLTPGVLADVYKGAEGGDLGGEKVKTVMEEIKRVRAKVKANVDAAGTIDEKKKKLRDYLLMQARDVGERDRFKGLIEKGNIDAGLAELDKRFADLEALHGAKGSENWMEVRYAAAELFVNLSSEEAWLERVRVVLGLDPLAHGLDSVAHTMLHLAAGVKQAIISDQGQFLSDYRDWVRRLEYEHENLYQANKKLAELKKVSADRQTEVQQRQTEVDRNKQELAAMTAATNVELDKLRAIESDLFAIQQRLGLALDATYKLDEQLRQKADQKK